MAQVTCYIPCLFSSLCQICVHFVSVTSVRTLHQRHLYYNKGLQLVKKIYDLVYVNPYVVQVYLFRTAAE